jgi:hypothetical protein
MPLQWGDRSDMCQGSLEQSPWQFQVRKHKFHLRLLLFRAQRLSPVSPAKSSRATIMPRAAPARFTCFAMYLLAGKTRYILDNHQGAISVTTKALAYLGVWATADGRIRVHLKSDGGFDEVRMRDGSDAVSDWPLLNALLNTASGATWVSVHHGGGVGIGKSIHAGVVVVADGTDEGARRLELVLRNDPGTGVMRHADAGYQRAIDVAHERGVRIPMEEA